MDLHAFQFQTNTNHKNTKKADDQNYVCKNLKQKIGSVVVYKKFLDYNENTVDPEDETL